MGATDWRRETGALMAGILSESDTLAAAITERRSGLIATSRFIRDVRARLAAWLDIQAPPPSHPHRALYDLLRVRIEEAYAGLPATRPTHDLTIDAAREMSGRTFELLAPIFELGGHTILPAAPGPAGRMH